MTIDNNVPIKKREEIRYVSIVGQDIVTDVKCVVFVDPIGDLHPTGGGGKGIE